MLTPKDYSLPHDEWRPYQFETIEWAKDIEKNKVKITEQPTGCHIAGQGILMFDGSIKKVEDIVIGDLLMGPDSFPRTVLQLCRGIGPMYRIIPIKGNSFIVNDEHILVLTETNAGKGTKRYKNTLEDGKIIQVSVKKYLTWSNYKKHIYKIFRTKIDFYLHEKDQLKIDPYFLGILLGDGSLGSRIGITTMDDEIKKEFHNQAFHLKMNVRTDSKKQNLAKTHCLVDPNSGSNNASGKVHEFRKILKEYKLLGTNSGTKFIPDLYKFSTRENRLELLAGILDTDGSLTKATCYDYISKSKQLADDVAFIVKSLGLSAYVVPAEKRDQNGQRWNLL